MRHPCARVLFGFTRRQLNPIEGDRKTQQIKETNRHKIAKYVIYSNGEESQRRLQKLARLTMIAS